MTEQTLKLSAAMATAYVHETFVVSEEEASEHVKDMIDLVESKGGRVSEIDVGFLCHRLTKLLNERCEWRSDRQKQAWLARQKETETGYNVYLDRNRFSPLKKW